MHFINIFDWIEMFRREIFFFYLDSDFREEYNYLIGLSLVIFILFLNKHCSKLRW